MYVINYKPQNLTLPSSIFISICYDFIRSDNITCLDKINRINLWFIIHDGNYAIKLI
jgi:hypothetical protein